MTHVPDAPRYVSQPQRVFDKPSALNPAAIAGKKRAIVIQKRRQTGCFQVSKKEWEQTEYIIIAQDNIELNQMEVNILPNVTGLNNKILPVILDVEVTEHVFLFVPEKRFQRL